MQAWVFINFFITLSQRNSPRALSVGAGLEGDASDFLAMALQEKVFLPSSRLLKILCI